MQTGVTRNPHDGGSQVCRHTTVNKPVQGLRILDCTGALPGPYATQLLADLGACVVKVERPPTGEHTRKDMPSLFEAFNRGKHSVILDLKSENGVSDYQRLAKHADVLVEGFRPGVMDRLGIGGAQMLEANPDLIYVSISGWGKTGVLAQTPGHDLNYLGMAGVLGDSSVGGISAPGVLMADLASGSMAAIAILAAVIDRDRSGRGSVIDLGMADVALSWAASANTESLFPRMNVPPVPHKGILPGHGIFATSDGQSITLGVIEDKFWVSFKELANSSRLESSRFDTFDDRRANSDELRKIIAGVIAERPAAYWLDNAAELEVPVFPVLDFSTAIEHPQFRNRRIVGIDDGKVALSFPAIWNGEHLSASGSAPGLGENDVDKLVAHWS